MSTTADAQAAAVPPTGGSSIKEMGMRKILFEKWDKQAASGELQKNPDILTKIYLGRRNDRHCIKPRFAQHYLLS